MLGNYVIFIFMFLFYTGLGIFVLLKNPANVINRRFCIFVCTFSVWVLFIFLTLQTKELEIAIFRLRLVFCAASFIPSTFFFFSSVFPDRIELSINRSLSISFFIVSIFLSFFSQFIVYSVSLEKNLIHAEYGTLFPVFWFYFVACMTYSLYVLFRKSVYCNGIRRLQIQYLYLGVAASLFLGTITNFLLPIIGIWQVERFVPLITVPIPMSVAYAIAKYHLMDISLIIKRSTIYVALSIILSATYFGVGMFLGSVLPVSEYKDTITTVVATMAMVLTFVSARESIQHIIEKVLFRTRYSHPKILSDSTVMFSSTYDLNGLLHYAVQYLYESIGMEKICILIRDTETECYRMRGAINFSPEDNLSFSRQDPIVVWFHLNRTVLSKDQLSRFKHNTLDRLLEDKLASLDVDSCIPVFQENNLFGIILLGRKINKKIFTQEDVQMFLAFSGQLAMAASNAHLYSGLKEAKIFRDNILQSLKNGVIVVDNNGEVAFLNNEARRILGLGSQNTTETVLKNLGKETYQILKHTLASDTEYHNIETVIEEGGKKIPCDVTTTKFKTEEGKRLGSLIILTDLTELKLLQAEKQHSERLAHLGTVAANIAHEIKNPLVAINTYFQLLPHKRDDKDFHTGFQQVAVKEIERINRIIEDLLNLSKPSQPILQHIDPYSVIMDVVSLLENTAKVKGVEIIASVKGRGCRLIADEDKIKQVLINILQNSIDVSPRDGYIKVNTDLINDLSGFRKMAKLSACCVFFSFAPFTFHELNNKHYYIIKVSDKGTGISTNNISHIFEPFFTNKDKGTGLGLAIVYRIIKDHEGILYVESKEGIGTDFYIGLPLSRTDIHTMGLSPEISEVSSLIVNRA